MLIETRKWMIVDKNGNIAIQNQYPRMSLINVKIIGNFIELTAPDMDMVRFPVETPNKYIVYCK